MIDAPDGQPSQLGDWFRDVEALCTSIRQGLAPLVAAKLATVVNREFAITEPAWGTYATFGLEITLVVAGQPRLVLVRPRGLSILGAIETGMASALNASGRVDIESGTSHAILLRCEDRAPPRWLSFSVEARRLLDERVFIELLGQLTELNLS